MRKVAFAITVANDSQDFSSEQLRYGEASMSLQAAWLAMAEIAGNLASNDLYLSVCSASKEDGPLIMLPFKNSITAILPSEETIPQGYPSSYVPAWDAAQQMFEEQETGEIYLISCFTGISDLDEDWIKHVKEMESRQIFTKIVVIDSNETYDSKRRLFESHGLKVETL